MSNVPVVTAPASSREGFLDDLFGSRAEQTLGGCAIGSVRDLFDAPDSAEQKLKRAQGNDFATMVVADTMAMIPKFKPVAAGLARSSLLVNPHSGLGDGVGRFGLNFVEGAALNKLGRSMLPGSSLHRLTSSRLGTGLIAESATHMSVGFGFGAVKSGFNPNSWLDEAGHISLSQGATSIAKAGAMGATINLPAGLLGMRAANLTAHSLRARAIEPGVAALLVGTTSGYSSGAVIGGIEAVKEGKSLGESLQMINTAGLIGAGTGMAFMASMPGRNELLYRFGKEAARPAPEVEASQAGALDKLIPGKFRRPLLVEQTPERINPESLEPPVGKAASLFELTSRLGTPVRTKERMFYLPDKANRGPFESSEQFFGLLKAKEESVLVYGVKGHDAKIVVKEGSGSTFVKSMEQVRRMRLQAEKSVPLDELGQNKRSKISLEWDKTPDQLGLLAEHMSIGEAQASLPVVRARIELSRHPYSNRALPEDFIPVIDELPNSAFVKDILIVDEPYVGDVWNRQHYAKNFETAATAGSDGRITFYKPKVGLGDQVDRYTIREFGNHEWSHLSAGKNKSDENLARIAGLVDKDVPLSETAGSDNGAKDHFRIVEGQTTDKYFVRPYARTNPGEDLAVHMGEEFLSPDVDNFYHLADQAPVRTVVFAKNISWALGQPHAGSRSVHGQMLSNRVQYVSNEVLPKAIKLLEQRLTTGTPAQKIASAEMLARFGDPEVHTAQLVKLASEPALKMSAGEVPQFEGVVFGNVGSIVPKTTMQEIAFDAAYRLNSRNYGHDGFEFLINQGRRDSPVRDLAVKHIKAVHGTKSEPYLRFLELAGDADNMTGMMDLLHSMPDRRGQRLVFDEILQLSSKGEFGQEFRRAFLARALTEWPGLRIEALDNLTLNEATANELILRRLSWGHDRQAASKADKLLALVGHEKNVGRARTLLDSHSPEQLVEGVRLSSQIKDDRLVAPLLEVVLNGSASMQAKALKSLGQYSPQVVKFHMRQMGRNVDSLPASKFDRFLTGLLDNQAG